jgi:hypothetical protein
MGGELPISSKYVESVLATKPIGYWRFEQLDDAAAKNEIAGGIDLRVEGNVRLAGETRNHVLDFTQIDSSAYLISKEPLQALAGSDYSVEVWMKPSHFHRGGFVSLMENPEVARGQHGLLLETHGAITSPSLRTPKRLRFLHRDPPASGIDTGTSCISTHSYRARRWQHVVATKKGDTMRLYLNGQFTAAAKDSSSLAAGLFLVLRWTAGVTDDRFFYGQLDELAVYDRALSKAEIENHYTAVRWSSKTRGAAKDRAPEVAKQPADSSS